MLFPITVSTTAPKQIELNLYAGPSISDIY